jgi:hypothetical protein
MYQADNDKAREALELLETGIAQIEKELNKFRDADGNLPAMYEGYETRVTIKRAFRKTLKDKAFMLNAAEERKQETDRASAQK